MIHSCITYGLGGSATELILGASFLFIGVEVSPPPPPATVGSGGGGGGTYRYIRGSQPSYYLTPRTKSRNRIITITIKLPNVDTKRITYSVSNRTADVVVHAINWYKKAVAVVDATAERVKGSITTRDDK